MRRNIAGYLVFDRGNTSKGKHAFQLRISFYPTLIDRAMAGLFSRQSLAELMTLSAVDACEFDVSILRAKQESVAIRRIATE